MVKTPKCKNCGDLGHYAINCLRTPKKQIQRTVIKKNTLISELGASSNFIFKKPRKKSTPRALAKDKAWDSFSLYIRTRDCLRFTGDPEHGMCVTCKRKFPRNKLQAGHFVAGRGNAVLFNERVVYSQCGYCNQKPPKGLGGNYANYTLFMFDEGYTREEIEAFLALKGTTKQYKLHDFTEIDAFYKEKMLALQA